MAGPDALVERAGEDVTIEFVTDYELDASGQLDPDSVETATVTVPAVVSNPTEEDVQRHEGRLSTGALRLTLPSSLRDATAFGDGTFGDYDFGGAADLVSADRGGMPDRVYRSDRDSSDRVYEVVTVQDDRNPLTGTTKLTALVDELEGHGTSIHPHL